MGIRYPGDEQPPMPGVALGLSVVAAVLPLGWLPLWYWRLRLTWNPTGGPVSGSTWLRMLALVGIPALVATWPVLRSGFNGRRIKVNNWVLMVLYVYGALAITGPGVFMILSALLLTAARGLGHDPGVPMDRDGRPSVDRSEG